MDNQWYKNSLDNAFFTLKSAESGLSESEANRRLEENGKNKLPELKSDGIFVLFLNQFKSPLIYILIVASVVVLIMGEVADFAIILAVLVFNSIVGTVQEGRAQNTLMALKKYSETKTIVLRDNKESILKDEDIVVGDIIILQEGEKIPADARIVLSNNLSVDEATLTGESLSVHKIFEFIDSNSLPIAEQRNMVFKGTNISSGSGRALVVATGIDTEIGKIAKKIAAIDTEIPLKKNIRYLSRAIIVALVLSNILLLVVGVLSGKGFKEMFTTLVSLSVSVIPEGLPIVMTLILAAGVWRMSKRNALVKKLQAVEALGQAEVIAVDKTGTITKNEMSVQRVFVGNAMYSVSGRGYEPKGGVHLDGKSVDLTEHPDLTFAVSNSILCNDAMISISGEGKWIAKGDPTEAAMLTLAEKIGVHKDLLEKDFISVEEFPFDYSLKYRASLRKIKNSKFLIVSGAPETIVDISKNIWSNGKSHLLSKKERENLQKVFEKMSSEGFRVIAVAKKDRSGNNVALEDIKNITFLGFFGMKDALRENIKASVESAMSAGIKVVMITGDHKITATAIAKEAGIYREGDKIVSGIEVEKMSDEQLIKNVADVSVFARVSPSHKLRIVNAFKANKIIVAMTGDGVNDAPSLVAADLGIAMGRIGTEVAKEAADIVLLDDNFNSIVSAIEEGRSIYKSIKKVILYLFSTNLGELFVISAAIFVVWPLPILPAQIIWLNFVTDGFLDVALAMEPQEKNILTAKFKKPNKFLVDPLMMTRMFLMAVCMAIGTLFVFYVSLPGGLIKAQTMSLAVLAVFQWFNAWNCKSEIESIFKTNPLSNRFLLGATVLVIMLQVIAIYSPFMQAVLHTTPLNFFDWLFVVIVASSIIIVEEARKLFYRKIK